MAFRIGLKLWSINTDYYIYEAIRLFENNTYDYIELYVVPGSIKELPKWEIVLKNHGIPFIIHCPHFAHGFNLAKKEKAKTNLEIYKEVKTFADKLTAEFIIFHGGIDGSIEETARQLASFKEPRALIENKPYKAIPNRMNGEYCRGYDINEIKRVIETAGCGFCLDFGHAICAANSQKKEIYSFVEDFMTLKPVMFHLTDIEDITSEYDSHPHIGEGELDIRKIIKMLPDNSQVTAETVKKSKTDLDDFIPDAERLYTLNFKIQTADISDMRDIFELSNDNTVRRNSINTEKITWENHKVWFKNRLNKPNSPFYIVKTLLGELIAQVKFDTDEAETVIGMSITEKFRGKKAAAPIIKECSERSEIKEIIAYVKINNTPSVKAFEKAGYENSGIVVIKNEKYFKYIFRRTRM